MLEIDSSSCDIYRLSSLLRSCSLSQSQRSLSLSLGQSRSSLRVPLPRAVIFMIVKPWRGFSQLSFVYVLFSFNIFLITYFWVVLSFQPPLDHNDIVAGYSVKSARKVLIWWIRKPNETSFMLLVNSLVPTIYVGSLLKSKRSKTTRTKEHLKQSYTNKIKFIYQEIHKRKHYKTLQIF